jgi:CDP-glucose 4,6-dehydratase
MENLVKSISLMDPSDLRILVTGHTGFKGAWLCEWLLQDGGGHVAGLALPPEKPESLFDLLALKRRLANHLLCDIKNADAVRQAVRDFQPDVIFHLAAQALVRRSYRQPQLTWETNVMGTLNVLEAARSLGRPVTVVAVTTDKVYRNREWEFAYREDDELGGHDPYSASKAASEIAVNSWRDSFANSAQIKVVTARAGNVIGPGDFNEDRIVPDCYIAWEEGRDVLLRNPYATRPWQHVLEPLSGYLAFASHVMAERNPQITTCNFGPGINGDRTVEGLVSLLAAQGSGRNLAVIAGQHPHEARSLALSIDRARHVLGWSPQLSFEETVVWTNRGYSAPKKRLALLVREQIAEYRLRLSETGST